jgi:hypothetical protein
MSCAGVPLFQTRSLSPFQKDFSPKIQTEVLQTLNTKVVKQVTLDKDVEGSWVVASTDRAQIAWKLD